jgi:hypothetical protein
MLYKAESPLGTCWTLACISAGKAKMPSCHMNNTCHATKIPQPILRFTFHYDMMQPVTCPEVSACVLYLQSVNRKRKSSGHA